MRLGSVKNAKACAAAVALCRQPDVEAARVHLSRVYIKHKREGWVRYATPPALRNEIIAFDRGGAFAPGEYKLSPLQPTIRNRPNAPKKAYKAAKKKVPQRGNRAKPHVVSGVRQRMAMTGGE